MGVNCVKDANGKVQVEIDEMKEEWRKDTEKLLNEENISYFVFVCISNASISTTGNLSAFGV